MEQNHDFGVDLMLKYAAIGNTFALSYPDGSICFPFRNGIEI